MRTPLSIILAGVCITLVTAPASGQAERAHVSVPEIAPRPEDVASVDGIMRAFYDVLSGPPGQAREWGRDRSLYIPGVRFVGLSENKKGIHAMVADHQTYVDAVDPDFVKNGFFEKEIRRSERRFGNMVQVWSAYESRIKADGPVIERGVNGVELYWDGRRWWIASVIWDSERPGNPIPANLLPATTP